MSALKLASRYAKSLLDLAIEKDELEKIYEDVQYINEVIRQNRDFLLLLKSPIVPPDKKAVIIEEIFNNKVHPFTFIFLEIMIKKGRERYLPEIAESFIRQYNEYKKIVPAELITAGPVDEKITKKISELVKVHTNANTVDLNVKEDEELIGGFILHFEDKLYDASVAHQLNDLKLKFQNKAFIKNI